MTLVFAIGTFYGRHQTKGTKVQLSSHTARAFLKPKGLGLNTVVLRGYLGDWGFGMGNWEYNVV